MFERFTDRSMRVVELAKGRARELGQDQAGTADLLYGFLAEGECVAAQALSDLGVTVGRATLMACMSLPGPGSPSGGIPFTPRMKKTLELGLREALQFGHPYIGTEHLLLGMTRQDDSHGMAALRLMGATTERVREAVLDRMGAYESAQHPEPVGGDPVLRQVQARLDRIERHLGLPPL